MASKEELSEQLALTAKLAAQVERMAQAAERLNQSYTTQIDAVEKLANAFAQINTTNAVQAVENLKRTTSAAADKMKDSGQATEKTFSSLGKKIEDTGKIIAQKFPKSVALGAAALMGLNQGFRNLISLGKGLTGFLTSAADGVVSFAASIVSFPLKVFERLIDFAANAGYGSNELAQAIENLRKQFGELYGPTNKAIIDTSRSMKGFSDTGLSAWRVFGYLADRFELLQKLATEMGAQFNKFNREFKDNGGALLAYQKGLGLNEEQMKGVAIAATATGRSMGKMLKDFTKFSKALADSDTDAKLLSRDMGKMASDVKHFGQLGAKELSEVALYARKLGIEVDKMTGTLDKFESFDQSAEAAAQLAQAFGANVDAFKLMESQNPAEQFDELRKAMFSVGKTADTMSRQELKLLAQQTGMDEQTAKLAFSMRNQGMSLDDIKKKSGDAEKRTLTQAQAMQKLADAIERMVKTGGAQSGSFWDMFIKGFLGGIQSSREFSRIIWDIKRSLWLVYMEGVRLGRAFVQMFPGVKEFLHGIADFFRPEKFKRLVGGVVDILKGWMKDLSDPSGKASFADLMKKLQKKFFNFFNEEAPEGKKMLTGFKTMLKTISKVMGEAMKWVADKIRDGIIYVTDLITGKKSLQIGGMGKGLGFLEEVILPLLDGLKHAWVQVAPALWELVKALGKKLFDFLKSDRFLNIVKPALPLIAGILFGPVFTRAIVASLATSMMKGAGNVVDTISRKAISSLLGKAAVAADKAKDVAGKGKGASEGLRSTAEMGKGAEAAIKSSSGWGVQDAVKLGIKLVAIAGALAVGGIMLAHALVSMKAVLEGGGIKTIGDVMMPLLVLQTMVIGAVPLMLSLRAVKGMSANEIFKGAMAIALGVGLGGATMAVALGTTMVILDNFGLKTIKDVISPLLMMGALVMAGMPLVLGLKVASKLGSTGDVLKGGLVIAAATSIVGITGALIGGLLSLVDPEKLVSGGKFMLMMSLVFLAMVPMIFAAMAVGALASGPQAIALAAAAVGLGVIGTAVGSMAEISSGIIEKLNSLTIDKDFQVKIDAFLGIIKAIQAFADTMVKLIKEMEPSFIELIKGSTTFPDKVNSAIKLIEELVGKKGEGHGVIGIIETVMDTIKTLATFPGLGEAAKIFSDVLAGVTGVIQAMIPPPEFFSAQTDFINILDPSIGRSLDQTMKGYMQVMQSQVTTIVDQVKTTVTSFATLNVPDPQKAQVVGQLLSSVTGLMKAVMPDPQAVKAFTNTVEEKGGILRSDKKWQSLDVSGMTKFMEVMSGNLKLLIPALSGDIIETIASATRTIDKDKLEKMKGIGDILHIIVDMVNAVTAVGKGDGIKIDNINAAASTDIKITKVMPDIATVIKDIGGQVGPLMSSIQKAVEGVPTAKSFMKNLEVAKTMFSFMGELPKLTSSLAEVAKTTDTTDVKDTNPLVNAVKTIGRFLNDLITGGTESPMTKLSDGIATIGAKLSGDPKSMLLKTVADVKTFFEALPKLVGSFHMFGDVTSGPNALKSADITMGLGNIGEIMSTVSKDALPHIVGSLDDKTLKEVADTANRIEKYGKSMKAAADVINDGSIKTALTAVTTMVEQVNDLNAALGEPAKIDFKTKLGKVASAVGLGGKAEFTVNPARNVEIHINMTVEMNAKDMEEALIMRTKSIIRNRLNWALNEPTVKAGPPIPATIDTNLADVEKST